MRRRNPKNRIATCRITSEVEQGLKTYSEYMKIGKCTLISLITTLLYQTLKTIDNDLKLLGKSLKEFNKIKDQRYYRGALEPLLEVIRNKGLDPLLADQILNEILKIRGNLL